MPTMKQNKGKDVMDEETRPGVKSNPRPAFGEKRKSLSLGVDLGNLPSRRKEKKARHKSSKPQDVQAKDQRGSLIPPSPLIQVLDVEPQLSSPIPSTVPTSSQTSLQVPHNLLEDENLAWEKFEKAVTDEDITACYNMSLKDFERFGVHDIFKAKFCAMQAMSKFIAASR